MTDFDPTREAPIALADVAGFILGSLRVRPALREVEGPGGKAMVEPRVMAVLVALAQERGNVLSRDVLIARCWAGRVVGDDAVSRCIAAIRRLASEQGADSFRVDTIARVGYRLVEDIGDASARATPAQATQAPPKSRAARGLLAATAAIGLLVSAGYLAGVFDPSKDASGWQVGPGVPLLDSPRIERHVAFHPGGEFFVYSEGAQVGERKLFVRRLNELQDLPVSELPGDHSAAAWSSSGARLAWIQNLPGQPCTILVMDYPGGSPLPAARCTHERFSTLAWSEDDASIYFLDRDDPGGPRRVYRQDLAGGAPVAVTAPGPGIPGDIALASHAGFLAIGRAHGDGVGEYFLLEVATGAIRSLVKGTGWHGTVAWLPDGESILVQREAPGGSRLFQVPTDGQGIRSILALPDRATRFRVGLAGQLAVERTRVRSSLRSLAGQSSEPQTLELSTGMSRMPTVSTAGTVAVMSTRSGNWTLWLGDGFPRHPVMDLGEREVQQMAWSPTGGRLAIALGRPDGVTFRVLDRDGRELTELELGLERLGRLGWGQDDQTLLVSYLAEGIWRAVWLDLATGKSTPLPGSGWIAVEAGPEGVFGTLDGRAGLWRIGTQPEQVSELPPVDRGAHWRWAGRRLYVPGPGPEPSHLEEWDIEARRMLRRIPRESDLLTPSWGVHPVDGSVFWTTGTIDTDVILHSLVLARP